MTCEACGSNSPHDRYHQWDEATWCIDCTNAFITDSLNFETVVTQEIAEYEAGLNSVNGLIYRIKKFLPGLSGIVGGKKVTDGL